MPCLCASSVRRLDHIIGVNESRFGIEPIAAMLLGVDQNGPVGPPAFYAFVRFREIVAAALGVLSGGALGPKRAGRDKAVIIRRQRRGTVLGMVRPELVDKSDVGTLEFSNDEVTLDFKQSIAATESLLRGAYGKTLVFTLSATTP